MSVSDVEEKCLEDLQQWPKSWMIMEEDLEYGKQLINEFKLFVIFLAVKITPKKPL